MRINQIISSAIGLALLTAPAIATSTTVPLETEKMNFEKQANEELKEWENKVKDLRAEIKKTHEDHKHHRHLKRAARHLESDIRDVKSQLSHYKKVQEKDVKHYEDHIRAEFEDMKTTYNKITTE